MRNITIEEFEKRIKELPDGWTKKKNRPRGTVKLNRDEWLRADRTLKLPVRVCLEGGEKHVRDNPGVIAVDGFEGSWLVEVLRPNKKKKNFNGNFATWISNVQLWCRGQCDGLLFGGAQMSGIVNVRVTHPKDVGIHIGSSTSRTSLQSIDVIGHERAGKSRGTGVYFDRACGLDGLMAFHLHRLTKGLVFYDTHAVRTGTCMAEHCPRPLTVGGGSSNIEVGPCDFQGCKDIAVDLTKCGMNVKVWGIIRRSEKTLYYLDRNGQRQPLVTGAHKAKGKGFNIEI